MRTNPERVIEDFSGDILVTRELLRAITRRIVEAIQPEKVILFGSYAYGEPTLDSDIDLLVVKQSRKRPAERARVISALFLHRRFGLDILVRTPNELQERLRIGDYFFREITQKGKVLYERRGRNGSRLGGQSRNGFRKRISVGFAQPGGKSLFQL
jgi:predicted nucleotidyltransferase